MKLKNYYKKQPILIFAPYNFLIFLETQLHEPKISKKTICELFGDGALVFFRRNFRIFPVNPPPPKVEAQNLTPPPPRRRELVSDWLKFTRAWVKTLRRLIFRISIVVWGELNQWGGG